MHGSKEPSTKKARHKCVRTGKETAEVDPLGIQVLELSYSDLKKMYVNYVWRNRRQAWEYLQGAIKKYTDIFEKQPNRTFKNKEYSNQSKKFWVVS